MPVREGKVTPKLKGNSASIDRVKTTHYGSLQIPLWLRALRVTYTRPPWGGGDCQSLSHL